MMAVMVVLQELGMRGERSHDISLAPCALQTAAALLARPAWAAAFPALYDWRAGTASKASQRVRGNPPAEGGGGVVGSCCGGGLSPKTVYLSFIPPQASAPLLFRTLKGFSLPEGDCTGERQGQKQRQDGARAGVRACQVSRAYYHAGWCRAAAGMEMETGHGDVLDKREGGRAGERRLRFTENSTTAHTYPVLRTAHAHDAPRRRRMHCYVPCRARLMHVWRCPAAARLVASAAVDEATSRIRWARDCVCVFTPSRVASKQAQCPDEQGRAPTTVDSPKSRRPRAVSLVSLRLLVPSPDLSIRPCCSMALSRESRLGRARSGRGPGCGDADTGRGRAFSLLLVPDDAWHSDPVPAGTADAGIWQPDGERTRCGLKGGDIRVTCEMCP